MASSRSSCILWFRCCKTTKSSAKGITDKDFLLAEKIESVVQWQPSSEDNTLEGTPDDLDLSISSTIKLKVFF